MKKKKKRASHRVAFPTDRIPTVMIAVRFTEEEHRLIKKKAVKSKDRFMGRYMRRVVIEKVMGKK